MREAAAREPPLEIQDREIKKTGKLDRRVLPQNSKARFVPTFGAAAPGPPLDRPIQAPQTVSTPNFTSVMLDEAGPVPPDTMGAIGPDNFLTTVNGRVRAHDKATGATGALDAPDSEFWAWVVEGAGGFVSDPRVRFDRLSDRWFLIVLDVPSNVGGNGSRILIARSDGPHITASTVWSFFYFDQDLALPAGDPGCLPDYPTLGIDRNALYIGADVFCGPNLANLSFSNTSAWVVRKSDLLKPTTPANLVSTPGAVTAFRGLLDVSLAGPYTPQGVDNYDPNATRGYFIGVDGASFGALVLREIDAPGSGSPTMSANLPLTVPATASPIDVMTPGGGVLLDGIDDRLMAAHLRGNQIWTSHQIEVDAAGVAALGGGRNGTRWYSIDVSGALPVLTQAGTVFDPSATNPLSYWMGSVMVSGQGHVAMGVTAASPVVPPAAATAGRLAGDPLGTTQGTPTVFHAGEANYSIGALYGSRWGDYSMTTLDPCDDMTMWTIQEFAATPGASPINWGARVVRLLAPPPAAPTTALPASIGVGQASLSVTITGNTAAGAGFYDTPAFGMSSCRTRIAASLGNGVTVNSVTLVNPSTVVLSLNTLGATPGPATVTITNPDGQSRSAGVLTLVPVPVVSGTKTVSGTFAQLGAIAYTVTLTNSGAGAQGDNPGHEFSDTLPSSLTLASANASGGTIGTTGNMVTWNGSIPAAGSVTITIGANINAGTAGQIVSNQGIIGFDANADGVNETSVFTDDPGVPGTSDPTVFQTVSGPLAFYTVAPCRVLDTRDATGTPALIAGADRAFTIIGNCGIPPSAKAVSVNLAVTGPTLAGHLRLHPGGTAIPLVSAINYAAGQTRANNAVLFLNAAGQIGVFCGQTSGTVHFIVDVNGYFQ